jgi:RNA polymerase sigma factor (sigma-70 family)
MWSDKASLTSSANSETVLTELRPALVAFFRRRCGNTAEAEDLAQDVLLRALTHARWAQAEEARSYIFKIAVNRWRERGRRKLTHGSEIDWNEDQMHGVAEEIGLERIVAGEAELQRMVESLQGLGERTRTILVLSRFEQKKQAEIADLLGISISAVEKHLVKGLAHVIRQTRNESDER